MHIAVRVERGLEKLKLLLQGNANRNVTRSVSQILVSFLAPTPVKGERVRGHWSAFLVVLCQQSCEADVHTP